MLTDKIEQYITKYGDCVSISNKTNSSQVVGQVKSYLTQQWTPFMRVGVICVNPMTLNGEDEKSVLVAKKFVKGDDFIKATVSKFLKYGVKELKTQIERGYAIY